MPLGWSIPVPSFDWIWLTVPELGRLQFSIDRQLKVPIFTFYGDKGGQISNFIFLAPRSTAFVRGVCPKMWPVAPGEESNKTRKKLLCVKLAICPDHPHRYSPLKFCVRRRVREVVIYFMFHETRFRGLGAVGRKSLSPTDFPHGLYNSLYYGTSREPQIHRTRPAFAAPQWQ